MKTTATTVLKAAALAGIPGFDLERIEWNYHNDQGPYAHVYAWYYAASIPANV